MRIRTLSGRAGLLLVAVVATALAAVVGWYGAQQFERLVVTRPFVVAQVDIDPYTLVTADMLTERDLPASLAQEQAVYVRPEEVVGQLTTTHIPAGSLIYRHQAVAPASFRYAAPDREVVSIPVDPAKAVAGQVRRGQRVNVYRMAWDTQGEPTDPATALARKGGAVEVLVQGARVVDVRSTKGEPAGDVRVANQSDLETQATTGSRQYPLTILVLEVSPDEARDLVRLMAERNSAPPYDLWVTLAPITTTTAGQ